MNSSTRKRLCKVRCGTTFSTANSQEKLGKLFSLSKKMTDGCFCVVEITRVLAYGKRITGVNYWTKALSITQSTYETAWYTDHLNLAGNLPPFPALKVATNWSASTRVMAIKRCDPNSHSTCEHPGSSNPQDTGDSLFDIWHHRLIFDWEGVIVISLFSNTRRRTAGNFACFIGGGTAREEKLAKQHIRE